MQNPKLNLSLIKSFCDVATFGSLSKAAERTRTSEATLSRHIKSLEEQLGLPLFERASNKLMLTEEGAHLREYANRIMDAANRFNFEASCHVQTPRETVRMAVSEGFSVGAFPPILFLCRELFPNTTIEILVTDDTVDVHRGDADLVFNTFCPLDTSLQSTLVIEHEVGAFASFDYVERHGEPQNALDLKRHTLIGGLHSREIVRAFDSLGYNFGDAAFKIRCDNRALAWLFMRSGLGIGFNNIDAGESAPNVKRILPEYSVRKEIWLTASASLAPDSPAGRIFGHLSDTFGLQNKPS
ncbi:MAG: LysR family transcriptional regulator [Pseudomonadota bacterium]|nr:LysR family transcriptional regulator [Pseudomonadota bacterium]